MTRRELLIILFKWKGTLLGITATVVIATTIFVYVIPETYEALASVLVEQNRAPTLRSALIPGSDATTSANNAIALITSRSVLMGVVDELKLHELPERDTGAVQNFIRQIKTTLAAWGLTTISGPREAWVQRLAQKLTVEPVIKSNVITIRYADRNSELAARIANAIVDGYVRHHWETYTGSGDSARYVAQLTEARATLARLRQDASELKKSVSAAAIDASQRALLAQIGDFREQRSDYEMQLAALLSRFENDHEEVRLVQRNIAQLKTQETNYEKELLALERNNIELEAIEADIRATEDYYRTFKTEFEEAQLNERSSIELVNVRVNDRASVPDAPAYSRLLLIGLSLLAGLMLAFSIAIIQEYFDRTVSDPETTEALLGVPDLGSVTDFGFLWSRFAHFIKIRKN